MTPYPHPWIFYQKIQDLLQQNTPFTIVTMVGSRGSAPQEVGAKMIISLGDPTPFFGTVGGGKVEAKAQQLARDMLQRPKDSTGPFLVTWNLQQDVGMTCGGEVTLYFENCLLPTWEVAIFGAGHVAQALIPLLLTLDCHITCIDSRPEWLGRLPDSMALIKKHTTDLPSMVESLPPQSFIISVTQGHATDLPIIKKVLSSRTPPFLGVIGSQAKANRLRSDLSKEGFSGKECQSIFCPLGLPIGKNSPPEIAISIVAQLLQERDHFHSANL